MDAKQDFRWDLQALRTFKDDEFKNEFNSFFCKWNVMDDIEWMRQTIIDYFMENGCLKNLKHVCKYLHGIGSNNGDDFLIQRLIKTHVKTRGNYWRASEIIAHLNMQNYFSFEEILVPLFVGSHADVDFFQHYIGKTNTAVQIKFVKFLDSTEDFNSLLQSTYSECKKPRGKQGFQKFLSKIIERFDLQMEEVAPNFCMSGKKKDIKHWIKWINYENIVRGNWRDLMIKKVGDKEPLGIFLIEELVRTKNDDCLEEASYLLDRLNLKLELLTSKVKSAIEGRPHPHNLTPSCKVYLADESAQYLLMNPEVDCSMVDDANSLQELCISLKNHDLWGIDCEFNADAMDSKVSLLQLANSNNQAFLVDVTALVSTLDKDAWNDFVDAILDENIQFLGYDPREDFKNLARTTDAFKKLQNLSDLRNILDIKALIDSARQRGIFELTEPSLYRGLARDSEFFLGKPLDKRQQISDWDKRPLSQAQKEYAVLDAQVLIFIYEAIYDGVKDDEKLALSDIECCLKRNGNKVIMQKSDSKNEKDNYCIAKDAEGKNMESMEERLVEKEPIKPPDLRVVCDNMLEGLCKQLRKYGVDAIAITSQDDVEQCAEIANIEDRVVLTRKKRLHQFLKIVSHGQCVALKADCPKDQLKEVFNFFHVIDIENYIFSRCMKCNGSNFNLVTQENFKSLQLSDSQKKPPEAVIDKHQEFYICDQCSHVYWNGSHLARVKDGLKEDKCF